MSSSRRRKVARSAENGDGVLVGLPPRRLIGRRPDRAAAHVAQVDELPVRVARGVAAPPRHRQPAPDAGAAAGVGHRGDVVAVREELRVRERGVRRAEAAHRASTRRGAATRISSSGRGSIGADVARHAFLQQQLGRLDARLRVKALDHAIAQQRVGQRDERHPLVVRQIGRDDDARAGGVGRSSPARRHPARGACSRSRRRTRTRLRGRPRRAGAGWPCSRPDRS